MGKTTLAWQLATHIARDTPVVFVTFEHAPTNLLLKALCARAGVNPQDVQRGQADLTLLRRGAGGRGALAPPPRPVRGGEPARPPPPPCAAPPGRPAPPPRPPLGVARY